MLRSPSPGSYTLPSAWASLYPSAFPSFYPSAAAHPSPRPSYGSTSFPSYGKSPIPTPAFPTINEILDAETQRAWDSAGIGAIAYNPDAEMTQGIARPVIVRITIDPNAQGLTKGLPPSPTIEALKVTGEMRAELKPATTGTFEINKTTEKDERPILPPYAEWKWMVTPLVSGDQTLLLTVTAIIELPDKRRREPVISKEASIHVVVSPTYLARTFLERNWQWVLGSPVVLGAAGWIWAHLRRKKKREAAGFKTPGGPAL